MDQPPPSSSAYGDSLSAAAAAAAAAAGYSAAAPGHGRAIGPHGFPAHGFPYAGFHGAPPSHAYAAAGYSAAAPGHGRAIGPHGFPAHGFPYPGFDGAQPGHAFAAAGYSAAAPNAEGLVLGPRDAAVLHGFPAHGSRDLPNAGFHGTLQGHPHAAPSTARFGGALPGYGYDAVGFGNDAVFDARFPVYAYASPVQGHHLPVESDLGRHQPIIDGVAPHVSDLNAGAPCFEPRDTGCQKRPIHSLPLEDARGAFNLGVGSFDRHASLLDPLKFGAGFLDCHASRQDVLNHRSSEFSMNYPFAEVLQGINQTSSSSVSNMSDPRGINQSSSTSVSSFADPFAQVAVRQIWRDNCLEAFQEIREIMANWKGRHYIALDLEYLAAASTDLDFRPFTPEQWYTSLQQYVNSGSVVQIGLAFASEDLTTEIHVFELNLCVDSSSGSFHEKALKFLVDKKHDLERHKQHGILPEWVCAGVLRSIPFGSENVIWVAYHGDRDVAFLLKLLEGGGSQVLMPAALSSFLHRVNAQFPLFYDLRVLSHLVQEGFRGKLEDLAGVGFLNLNRKGEEHHAGSDALLTLECFAKILQDHKLEAVVARRCLLSGVQELQLPITCYRSVNAQDIIVVDVYSNNFDQEAEFIVQTIASNFNLIGAQIVAPRDANVLESDYNSLRLSVEKVNVFELFVSFMSLEGNLAFGRAWKIHLQVQSEDPTRVNAQKLAALFASCGATHQESSLWVTFGGEYGLACLLRSFVAPGVIPLSVVRYNIAMGSLFPHVYDVKEELCAGTEATDLREVALQLGVSLHACDAVSILRCFFSLRTTLNKHIDD